MYDHVGLKTKNLTASVRFYRAALAALGHDLCSNDEASAGFGPKGAPAFWLYHDEGTHECPTHVAFTANERAAVRAFHEAGLKTGGRDHGAPGLRNDYGPSYYAAFLTDPDGNNVEAVCLK